MTQDEHPDDRTNEKSHEEKTAATDIYIFDGPPKKMIYILVFLKVRPYSTLHRATR